MSTPSTSTPNTAQERFDKMYVTSTEIQQRLNVVRSVILKARHRGMLPDPVVIPGLRAFIWERENVTPYLDAWELSLASHRGELQSNGG